MMNKKGQVTVFIIIGILILVGVSILIFFNGENEIMDDPSLNNFDRDSVNKFVQLCIDSTTLEGIKFISLRGGFFQVPRPSINLFNVFEVPFYYFFDQKRDFSESIFSNQLSLYIEDNLNNCLKNFSVLKSQGYLIELGNLQSECSINEKDLTINLDYPLIISNEDHIEKFENFQSKLSINLNPLFSTVEKILEIQSKNLEYLPLGNISLLSDEKFKFRVNYIGESRFVISLFFDYLKFQNEIFNDDLIFNLGFRYDWGSNYPPDDFVVIPSLFFNVNQSGFFNNSINASGINLDFESFSNSMEINSHSGNFSVNLDSLNFGKSVVEIDSL